MAEPKERKPFWAKCGDCAHCWPAAYAPMPVITFARTVMRARCPMCGSKNVLVAKQDDGELSEPTDG